ncbi:hypothetical protein [Sphingomonas sp.]|uniref:hypothetical protein n=1 Tax=Sphingomonas sp. TaxID=28214 RepID=UPI00286BB427|nr:hypothetical protein [Sphingomonas sp.]
MPSPDPVPSPNLNPNPNLSLLRRFRKIMAWLALFSIVIAAIAVLLVARGDSGMHIHMLIATALGVGLTVLLATGLMSLMFLSSASGHDDAAARPTHEDDL